MAIEGWKIAQSLMAQLITVSTTLLAFTITFAEKFKPDSVALVVPDALRYCWLALLAATLFGFLTIMAITGTLLEIDKGEKSNATDSNIKIPAALSILSFFLALVLMVIAGWCITSP